MKENKKEIILGTIIIFILGFFIHNLYEWVPNFLTSVFAPVNESVWEHMKLFFTGVTILMIIQYIIKNVKSDENNIEENILARVISIIIMMIVMIVLFYMFSLVFGNENFIVTLILFFISILIGQISYVFLKDYTKGSRNNFIGIILYLILLYMFIEFTYNPIELELFRDPLTNKYGI